MTASPVAGMPQQVLRCVPDGKHVPRESGLDGHEKRIDLFGAGPRRHHRVVPGLDADRFDGLHGTVPVDCRNSLGHQNDSLRALQAARKDASCVWHSRLALLGQERLRPFKVPAERPGRDQRRGQDFRVPDRPCRSSRWWRTFSRSSQSGQVPATRPRIALMRPIFHRPG
jgi:hypothetical protein